MSEENKTTEDGEENNQKQQQQQQKAELKQFFSEIQQLGPAKSELVLNLDVQLERLTTQQFQNPYDVFCLDVEATDEEIKSRFRRLSLLVHPDKCKGDEQMKQKHTEAFHVVEQANKTLSDPDKKKIYQRVVREAKERTEFERNKEDKKRKKQGLPPLPKDTFDAEFRSNCKKLFDEIEERKLHYMRLQESQKQKKKEEIEEKQMKSKIRELSEEDWEKTRDDRVNNWRNFSKKKSVIGTKKSNKQIRAPMVKMESRPASAPKQDLPTKPMGINEDYKKTWK